MTATTIAFLVEGEARLPEASPSDLHRAIIGGCHPGARVRGLHERRALSKKATSASN
jgi:hypothetical protein